MPLSHNIQYIPGVCNIGPEEIARRKTIGWIAAVITVILFVVLFVTHVSPYYRFLLIIPASMAAAGFIQARMKFCFGFAQKGVFNLGKTGTVESVTDQESLAKDRNRGAQIIAYSISIGIIIAVIAVLA